MQRFTCVALLRNPGRSNSIFGNGPFTLSGMLFHTFKPNLVDTMSRVLQPQDQWPWFGLFRFRSPLLTESSSLSFPPVTEMFHFTGYCEPAPMNSERDGQALPQPGYPIRKSPGIKAYVPLPEAYRSLSRPSSPAGTKASTIYSYLLVSVFLKLICIRVIFFFLSECFSQIAV